MEPHLIRNIGIAAHIDAGKTTLTERLLFYTGRTHRMGEVHEGTTIMDYLTEERERGITITAAATQTQWLWQEQEYTINIIDTPGHVDFTVEVERSLRVCDGLIVLFSAVHGVEPQSETVWRQADRYKIPRLAFLNKMDLPGADYEKVLSQIEKRLGARPLLLQLPLGEEEHFEGVIDLVNMLALMWHEEAWEPQSIPDHLLVSADNARQQLLETLGEFDETILTKVFDAPDTITEADIRNAIRHATLSREIVPVLLGSAYRNKGIQPALDAVCTYLPSPADVGAVRGVNPQTGEPELRELNPKAPFTALVFKIAMDEQHRKMAFFRVYAGHGRRGDVVMNPRTGHRERLANLFQLNGGKHNPIWEVSAGDIAALVGVKDISTGDTLCDADHLIQLESIQFPKPVIAMVIEARHSRDLDRLQEALHLLEEEDPSFLAKPDEESGQLLIHGMGELHLEIMSHRLRDDFKIEVNLGRPQVNYKEQLSQTVAHAHEYTREVGERLYAGLSFELGPPDSAFLGSPEFLSGRTKVQFESALPEGTVKPEYLQAVHRGFDGMLLAGPLAGFEVHSIKVRVTGTQVGPDSNALAFELCAREGFRAAAPLCAPILAEPVMDVEVTCPEDYTNPVLGDLNRRRGIPTGMEVHPGFALVKAQTPLAELFGYAADLRTLTSGRGTAAITFSHYAPAPDYLAQKVLERRRGFRWG